MSRLLSFMLLSISCLASHAASLQLNLVDREGKPLPDAVVVLYATGKPTPPPPAAPASPWIVSQEKMKFVPAVTVTVPGATLRFTNLDRYDHHVRGTLTKGGIAIFSDSNPDGFELYLDGRKEGKDPTTAEHQVMKAGVYQLGCHLHGSMKGHVFVTDSAWTIKSDAEGKTRFDGLPIQAIEVRIWHPDMILEGPRLPVRLIDGLLQQNIQVDVLPRRRRS